MGGGVILVQTKSGGDNFHGALWEFFRNTALDDRNYFSPTVPPEHQNIFGWQVGGPVLIPHLYSKNNHKTGSEQEFDERPILCRLSDLLKFNEFGIGDGHAFGLQQ